MAMSLLLTLELALSTMRETSEVTCPVLSSTVGCPVCPGSSVVDSQVHPGLGRRESSVWWWFFLTHSALGSLLGQQSV